MYSIGFRRRRQCANAIFVLRRLVDQHLNRGKELFVCFIDITKAYDSVDRKTAWETLLHRGAPPKVALRSGKVLGVECKVRLFLQGDCLGHLTYACKCETFVNLSVEWYC